jgi:hypothetical protein
MKAEIGETTVTVRWATRPVALKYARRLLPRADLTEPDPHCSACGHRALDHGLGTVPADQRRRWFSTERTPCAWCSTLDRDAKTKTGAEEGRPCDCAVWIPNTFERTGLEGIGEARVLETWIEVPVSQWIVAYRVVEDHGRVALGELRVFPGEPGRPGPGQWSGELLGPRARVPKGGITAGLLRQVRVRAYSVKMSDIVKRLRTEAPGLAPLVGWGVSERTAHEERGLGQRRGPKGRPPLFYAQVARDYVKAVERGSLRPVAHVALRRGVSNSKGRDMIRRARELGLLSLEGPGRRGGVLLEPATELLHQTVEQTLNSPRRRRTRRTGRGRRELSAARRRSAPRAPRAPRAGSNTPRARAQC